MQRNTLEEQCLRSRKTAGLRRLHRESWKEVLTSLPYPGCFCGSPVAEPHLKPECKKTYRLYPKVEEPILFAFTWINF